MNNINFHRLHIFHTVARMGSFTKAAAELGISQPAVSIQVRELESNLGVTLLVRIRSGVSLTDTGEVVYQYTRRIFSLADEMTHSIQNITGLKSGRLTIGSSSTPGEYILPLAIGVFRQRHPQIEITLSISNTEEVIEQILNRDTDLGMVGSPISLEGLKSFPYVTDEVIPVVSARHALTEKGDVRLDDIAKEPFIMRESGSATRHAAESYIAHLGMKVHIGMELGSNEAVKRAAAAGLGIGLLSKFSIDPDVAAGYISALKVRGWRCERPLTVFYRDEAHMTTAQLTFLNLLRDEKPLPSVPM